MGVENGGGSHRYHVARTEVSNLGACLGDDYGLQSDKCPSCGHMTTADFAIRIGVIMVGGHCSECYDPVAFKRRATERPSKRKSLRHLEPKPSRWKDAAKVRVRVPAMACRHLSKTRQSNDPGFSGFIGDAIAAYFVKQPVLAFGAIASGSVLRGINVERSVLERVDDTISSLKARSRREFIFAVAEWHLGNVSA